MGTVRVTCVRFWDLAHPGPHDCGRALLISERSRKAAFRAQGGEYERQQNGANLEPSTFFLLWILSGRRLALGNQRPGDGKRHWLDTNHLSDGISALEQVVDLRLCNLTVFGWYPGTGE